jgi:putative transcriptional regulator
MKLPRKSSRGSVKGSFLDGKLLLAMPSMTDKRFARSVIYMCAHSNDGAMGLIINQRAANVRFSDLLQQLGILPKDSEDAIPAAMVDKAVHVGGPVETGRGFVLHSSDYFATSSTLAIDKDICLTATMDILKAMAAGKGPAQAILALGYAGWAPGQLELEFQGNGWLHCAADADIIFNPNLDQKYDLALSKMGIDPTHLVSDAGHA